MDSLPFTSSHTQQLRKLKTEFIKIQTVILNLQKLKENENLRKQENSEKFKKILNDNKNKINGIFNQVTNNYANETNNKFDLLLNDESQKVEKLLKEKLDKALNLQEKYTNIGDTVTKLMNEEQLKSQNEKNKSCSIDSHI